MPLRVSIRPRRHRLDISLIPVHFPQLPAVCQQLCKYFLTRTMIPDPVSSAQTHVLFALPSQRHVTRQKILNWKQSLRFPSRPRVSHEGVNLMEQLLCEPDDRLGSQSSASVSRPNSIIVNARRSGFIPTPGLSSNVDGANLIKVCLYYPMAGKMCVLIFHYIRLIPGSEELIG
jgi:hypothetical protein